MNKIFLFLLLIASVNVAHGQNKATIQARLTDKQTQESIPGAVIELTPTGDTLSKKYYTTNSVGVIKIEELVPQMYRMRITFIGYEPLMQTVNATKGNVQLGVLTMTQTSHMLEDVVMTGQAMRTSQKGDTLIYNAASYKVNKDADTESLLSKMPGITIINGEVEAQGEKVKKVFVDGKEFFGQDVNTAIKNLPAEIVDKIEVYNKLSDQSEFTGVDDGEGYKAINIVTAVSSGQFGRAYAGYGFNDKYMAGANMSIFSGDSRISLMGMANNVNQQNFSIEDILGAMGSGGGMRSGRGGMRGGGAGGFMVNSQAGISTIQSFGVNYNDKWSKKLDISASYFFNHSKNENIRENVRNNISDAASFLRDIDTTNSDRKNMEHRFNARLEYKINDNQNLMWRPSVSFQNYRNSSDYTGAQFSVLDALEDLLSTKSGASSSRNWGYNVSNSLLYRLKLGKPGRTITANGSFTVSDNDGRSDSYSIFSPISNPLRENKQEGENSSKSYSVDGSLMYTEPIVKNLQFNTEYRVSYRYSDSDREIRVWDPISEDFLFNEERSSIYNSGYLTHRVGPGLNYSKDKNILTASVYYQRASLVNDQDFPLSTAGKNRYSFDDVVYFAMMHRTFKPGTSLRVFARSSTSNPSISQLQTVIKDSDQQNISTGNPDLDPSYSHMVRGHFVKSNVAKGRTFMLMGAFNYQSKYISDYTYINLTGQTISLPQYDVELLPGARFSRPINIDGNWSLTGGISYGFPLNFIKSNLNINLGARYNKAPTMFNDKKNTQTGQYYNAGLVLGSNISENIDFTINYNAGYNMVSNSQMSATNINDKYFSQAVSTNFKWIAWKGFTLSGSVVYSQYKGITNKDYNEDYLICNLYVGKKVLKHQRGEIIFGVNDLFNRETGYSRTVRDTYIEDVRNKAMGRYFGFQFVYNLRNFGKSSNSTSNGKPSTMRDRPVGHPAGVGRPSQGSTGSGGFGPR